jgi:TIR domain
MARVFISWASPDKPVVTKLANRLQAEGLDCFISLYDMEAGDNPIDRVRKEMRDASLAIFLLSDQVVDREWIVRELEWCIYADKPIVTVTVGELAAEKVPKIIANLNRIDLSGPDQEGRFSDLVSTVWKWLRAPQPVQLPCALFAMTQKQCAEVVRDKAGWQSLRNLCQGVSTAEIDTLLQGRYGDSVDDFSPFEDGTTMRKAVLEAMLATNQERVLRGRPPIHAQWFHEALMGDPLENKKLRDVWAKAGSLLIVDSVSTCHDKIFSALQALPQPQRLGLASVLWIPPYTRCTASLEALTEIAAYTVPHLGDAFSQYRLRSLPERWAAFDITTPASLWTWVYRVVHLQPDGPVPFATLAQKMNQANPSGFSSTNQFHQSS